MWYPDSGTGIHELNAKFEANPGVEPGTSVLSMAKDKIRPVGHRAHTQLYSEEAYIVWDWFTPHYIYNTHHILIKQYRVTTRQLRSHPNSFVIGFTPPIIRAWGIASSQDAAWSRRVEYYCECNGVKPLSYVLHLFWTKWCVGALNYWSNLRLLRCSSLRLLVLYQELLLLKLA